ncbi:T9SS type B sorting domain-containing protein [Sphingobacterium pedocola]|uniref:Gliding motility-associated C-terminal domain-containing protein n=1 Tax=Sphingobacterium pedocola TaxID=2082722 RepID=A0ABR9TAG4_9SPHI|nr:gliding motility-associated C-terminal domain-containing protein [Sphingobacterium pedocola]MBE8722089.1 hypothetical protein [Sphingobacterium pedocola]
MKKRLRNIITFVAMLISFSVSTQAQTGLSSFVTHNGPQTISSGTFEVIYSESLYFGPNADVQLDGDLIVYSRNIWIAPTARIHGSGTLTLHSPASNPMYAGWATGATVVDGNNNIASIDVTIVLNNDHGMILENIEGPYPEGGTFPSSKTAALRISRSIDLAVNGANIYLNGHDFELGTASNILHANRDRMVVTDDRADGHLIKNYLGVSAFLFPVGIAAGDYTPATLTPSTAGRQVYVSVTSYGAATSIDFSQADIDLGMDRVWNIYADESLQMSYRLQHNMATHGVAYVDADARIVQNADGGNWIGDVTVFNGEGIHTREDIETRTGNTLTGTWFTKQSLSLVGPTANDDGPVDITYGRNTNEIPAINVLENDEPGSSAIVIGSIRVVTPPLNGRTQVNPDGSITYIPNEGYVGEDRFEYEIMDENGLRSTAWVTVNVLPRNLIIPNVFTPNGDGKNDRFEIVGHEGFDRIDLVILNRWGNEVYSSSDYRNEWDGSGLNEGTYFYLITAHNGTQTQIFKGSVLIKRQ